MLRDLIGFAGMYVAIPVATQKLMVKLTHTNENKYKRLDSDNQQTPLYITLSFLCSVTVSTCLVILTQPLDTVRSVISGDLESKIFPKSAIKTAKILYNEHGGIKRFYNGVVPRCLRFIGHIFIVLQIKQWFANKKVQYIE